LFDVIIYPPVMESNNTHSHESLWSQ